MRKPIVIGLSLLLVLLASPSASAQEGEVAIYTITMSYEVKNIGSNEALNTEATVILLDNVSGWADQEVLSENITLEGSIISPQIHDEDDNRWVSISLDNLSPDQSKTITVTQVLRVRAVDFSINPSSVGTTIPSELNVYTQPVDGLFESADTTLENLAQQLTENTTNYYYMARQIFDFMLEDPENQQELDLRYKVQTVEHSGLWAYEHGIIRDKGGDCTEFSNLFITLARAVGIPAKAVSGYGYFALYSPTAGATDVTQIGHAYSIFYLPNYGWVPADAVWPQYTGSFGEMDYAHIAGVSTGGEEVIDDLGQIIWHGPGYISRSWEQYTGQPTTLGGSKSGSITPEVLADTSVSSPTVEDDVLTMTMTITNMGQSTIDNLVAELENIDQTYFEVLTLSQQKDNLASGEEWSATFQVQLAEGAYDKTHTFTSKVTYDSSYENIGGTYLALGDTRVSISEKPASTPQQDGIVIIPEQVQDFLLYALIGVLVGAVAVAGVVLARGRKRKIVQKRRTKSVE